MSASTPAIATASRATASSRRQLLQPGPRTSTIFMAGSPSQAERVEQEADGEDAGHDDSRECGHQADLHDPAQDHELRQADGDDRHHEGERGTERQALAKERLDDRDGPRRVRVERDRDRHDDRHREWVVTPADLGDQLHRDEAVDERPDPDPDDHVEQDLADEVPGRRPRIAQSLLDRETEVERRRAAPGPDREDPRLDPLLEWQASEHQPADAVSYT